MRKNHSSFWLALAVGFIAIVYSCLLFLLKPIMDISAWTLYVFTIIAFVLMVIQLAFGSGGTGTYPQFDYVNIGVTLLYTCIQFIIGGILLMRFDGLPFVQVVCVEIAVLAVYLVYTFVTMAAISHADAQDVNTAKMLEDMRRIVADIQLLADKQPQGEVKQRLLSLAKEARYQDVVTPPELAPLETRIRSAVDGLCLAVEQQSDNASSWMTTLEQLLQERKQASRAIKH